MIPLGTASSKILLGRLFHSRVVAFVFDVDMDIKRGDPGNIDGFLWFIDRSSAHAGRALHVHRRPVVNI